MTDDSEKRRLAEAIRMLERLDIVDFNGHCSTRRDGGLLINSGKSVRSALTAADIVAIDSDGQLVAGGDRPPMEFHIHTEIYRRRPDVGAIVHAHPRWSTLFTMAGREIRPVFAQGTLLGGLPVFPSPLSINTREAGEQVAGTLGGARAVLLRSHGSVVVGADIVEAFVLCVYLEQNAERQYMAERLGTPHGFDEREIAACRKNLFKRGLFEKCWDYYAAKFTGGTG